MNEIGKYGVQKEKLKGLCDEHDLIFSIHNEGYPFRMTIKPAGGMDAQQTMLEGMDNPSDTGYISPDASLVFVYRDGELAYKISETWTISATLFNKLKNLFTKLREAWFAYFFRDIHQHNPTLASAADEADGETEMPDSDNETDNVDNENDGFVTAEDGGEEQPFGLDEDGHPIDAAYVRSVECPEDVMDPGDSFPVDVEEEDPFDESQEEETADDTPEDTGAEE